MLATRAAEWKQQWLREGEQKGRLEGEQKGRVEGEQRGEQKGEAKVLLRLLERRFGSVPDAMKARIAAADVSQLDTWIMRVLDAGSIEEVLS